MVMSSLMADPRRTPSFMSLARSAGVTLIRLGSLREFAPHNAILGLEVFDVPDEFLLGRAGDQQQQRVQQPCHGSRFRNVLIGQKMTWFWNPAQPMAVEKNRPGIVAKRAPQST